MVARKQHRTITSNVGVAFRGNKMNEFTVTLTAAEMISLLKALYWYEDKLTNTENPYQRDSQEWDTVVWMRTQLGNLLKAEAKV
jgi:hypothetical protein